MRVLSLFDGISCGRVALERAGIPVDVYYASEIDKYTISVAQAMYPDTVQIGDVCKIDFTQYIDKIDMIIGGSPCQDLSIAKQNRQGLQGERSRLFWEYIKALTIIKPKYFLLENVASMKKEDRDAITAVLRGIYPETECIMINSALVSAQQRKRYYWTNWHVEQPEDKGILLKDILEDSADSIGATMRIREDENGKFKRLEVNGQEKSNALTSVQTDSMVCEPVKAVNKFQELKAIRPEKSDCLIAGYYKAPFNQSTTGVIQPVRVGQIGKGGQGERIYHVEGKSVSLSANGGGLGAKTGLYKVDLPDGDYVVRKLTPRECARLQTYPEHCFDVANISNTQWYKAFGNGWTVDVIAHIFKGLKNGD